jgi:hypothetical protein
MATKQASKAEAIEAEIIKQITAASIRLRFDKVALRLVDGLKANVIQILPASQSVVFTVTAPLKHPAKTGAALQGWLRDLPLGGSRKTINGNDVRARRLKSVSTDMPKVIGFVHNPESNADLILNLAETSLSEL